MTDFERRLCLPTHRSRQSDFQKRTAGDRRGLSGGQQPLLRPREIDDPG